MTREEAIEKIKKLLRMKRGGTPDEVATALALAAELARKHGVELGTVNPEETTESEQIGHVAEVLKSKLPLEAKLACAILVNFFNVQAVVYKRAHWVLRERICSVNFVGTQWDRDVAVYVFRFLQVHFRSCWNRRPNKRLRNRFAFLNGMFLGLATKLEQEKRAHTDEAALVFVGRALELRKQYVQKHWPRAEDVALEEDDSDAHASGLAGVRAGQNTNIRPAVGAPKPAAERRLLQPAAGQMNLL